MQNINIHIVKDASDSQDRSLRWVSRDGQGEYTGWEVPAGSPAEVVIQECVTELLSQCGTDEDREGILAGTIEIKAVKFVGQIYRPHDDVIVVWLTKEGEKRYGVSAAEIVLKDNSYVVLADGDEVDLEIEYAPGSPTEGAMGVECARKDPANAVFDAFEIYWDMQRDMQNEVAA